MKNTVIVLLSFLISIGCFATEVPKIIKKVPPEFPDEAIRKNIHNGTVKARIFIDAQGNVKNVDIISTNPPAGRVFTPATIEAVTKWKFEATGKQETAEISLMFSNE